MSEAINVDHYEIVRSSDGVHFSLVNRISDVSGNTNYSYIDKSLVPGTYYYRVKVVEKSGASYYTSIRAIKIADNNSIKVYPNPVKNGLFSISTSENKHKTIMVFDSRGMLRYSYSAASTLYKVDATTWAKGVYMVSVISDDGQVQTKQLVLIK